MHFLLSNTALLPLAALIAVPILVHLFARSRPPHYHFSTTDYILRVVRMTMRIRKPREWLLLILRVLLIAAIVALFLRPIFFSSGRLAGRFEQRNMIILVDRSASMGCMEGGQTRFAAACAEATEVLGTLQPGDTANVVWIDAAPSSEFPAPGVNTDFLHNALRRAQVTRERGSVDEALRLAVGQLNRQEGVREICIISDFQATQWKPATLAIPEEIRLVTIPVSDRDLPNTAISAVEVPSRSCVVGDTVTINCRVANYSQNDISLRIFFRMGEQRDARDLQIPANDTATVPFRCLLSEAGEIPVAFSSDDESFAPDNTIHAVLHVREQLNSALCGTDQATRKVWARALNALGRHKTTQCSTINQGTGLNADIIMVAGWDGDAPEQLRQAAKEGAVVICSLASEVAPDSIKKLMASNTAIASPPRFIEQSDAVRIKLSNPDHALFGLFRESGTGNFASSTFHAYLKLPPGNSLGSTLLEYEDGTPALIQAKDIPLFIWNLPLEQDESNWISSAEFIPLFGELISFSTREKPMLPALSIGDVATYACRDDESRDTISLLDGDSAPIELKVDSSGERLSSARLTSGGIYRWQSSKRTARTFAVVFPESESDFTLLSTDELEKRVDAVSKGSCNYDDCTRALLSGPLCCALF